mmetsp:Transcript_115811/g.323900  ORF Transcript_115811/g.323900 Transcript_115811/m.323900 type:complete len:212 (-) Transcript_115811:138-773(-)
MSRRRHLREGEEDPRAVRGAGVARRRHGRLFEGHGDCGACVRHDRLRVQLHECRLYVFRLVRRRKRRHPRPRRVREHVRVLRLGPLWRPHQRSGCVRTQPRQPLRLRVLLVHEDAGPVPAPQRHAGVTGLLPGPRESAEGEARGGPTDCTVGGHVRWHRRGSELRHRARGGHRAGELGGARKDLAHRQLHARLEEATVGIGRGRERNVTNV